MSEQTKQIVHVIVTMQTFGEQYQKIELMNCGTSLDSVKEMQKVSLNFNKSIDK